METFTSLGELLSSISNSPWKIWLLWITFFYGVLIPGIFLFSFVYEWLTEIESNYYQTRDRRELEKQKRLIKEAEGLAHFLEEENREVSKRFQRSFKEIAKQLENQYVEQITHYGENDE